MRESSGELLKWTEMGERLLRVFHSESKSQLTFDQFKAALQSRRGQGSFVRNFGGTVIVSGTSESDAIDAMKTLGRKASGKIPSRNQDFIDAIVRKATDFSYVDAVTYTAKETAKTVVTGVESVGNTLIQTGKIINFIFPALVLLAIFFWFRKKFV